MVIEHGEAIILFEDRYHMGLGPRPVDPNQLLPSSVVSLETAVNELIDI